MNIDPRAAQIGRDYRTACSALHPAIQWDTGLLRRHLNELFALYGKPLSIRGPYADGSLMLACTISAHSACEEIGPELAHHLRDVHWRTGVALYGYFQGLRPDSGWFYVLERDLHCALLLLTRGEDA